MTIRSLKTSDIVLLLVTASSLVVALNIPRVGQNPAYHNFADQREILGIPNFLNVITNLPFVLIGIAGLLSLNGKAHKPPLAYLTLFCGIILIGLGSAWYHLNPTNATLVWDRIPMSVTFMSYFSIIVSRYVDEKTGNVILIPLLLLGILSVCYWYITEKNTVGDLRLYAWVQFYPMLSISLILIMYNASSGIRLSAGTVILIYAIAKVAEHYDGSIYDLGNLISGHSVKHIFATWSVWVILSTLGE